jgi:hypothetical protein
MFSPKTLRYLQLAAVTAGNLIYIQRGEKSVFALRIDHPGKQAGDPTNAAALILRDKEKGSSGILR